MDPDVKDKSYLDILKLQLSSFHNSKNNLYLSIFQVFLLKSSINFIVYLTSLYYIEIWEISDKMTGYLICLESSQIIFTFVAGNVVDRIGIRDAYILAGILGVIGYSVLLLIKVLIVQILIISCFLGFEAVLIFTTLKTNIAINTDFSNRSFTFSMLNVATQVSSIVYGGCIKLIFGLEGVTTTGFNIIFGITIVFFVISLVLSLFFTRKDKDLSNNSWTSFGNIKDAFNMKRFWKLLVINLISSIPLSTIYLVGMMLPIYMKRELDDTSDYGLFVLSYSLIVIFFCFILSPIFTYLTAYTFMIISSAILASAPLVLIISPGYWAISIYIVTTAFGSSIFETRLTEYHGIASMPGMKGTYICLINVAYSIAFLVTGLSSGLTLNSFCPEDGPRDCWAMWLTVSAIGFLGTILLWVFRGTLEYKYDQEEIDPYVYSKDKY